MPLDFGFEGQDAVLEWRWYYDEDFSIELDSITWNRAQATPEPTLVPITQSPFAPYTYGNSITPVPDSGTLGCETTSTGCYIPNNTTFTVGDVVTFYNSDTQPHTFTSGTPADGPDGKFDSGLLLPRDSSGFSSDVPGNFSYYCTLHPWMVGMFMVEHSDFTKPSLISVFTDGISYHGKEHIEIYGTITKPTGPTFVRINVATTDGFTVYNSITTMNWRVSSGGDSTFDRTVIPDERLWREGTYVVTVSYGAKDPKDYESDNILATTSFDFTGFGKTSVDYETGFDPIPETDFDSIPETDFDSIPETDFDSLLETYLDSLLEEIDESETNDNQDDSQENDSYSAQQLLNQEQKKISITKQLDPQTQNKVKTLDSKITREQTQYDEYLKQYDYYEEKTLSPNDAKKFQIVTGKLDTQSEKIDSLIDERNTIIFESEDVSESIESNSEPKFYSELHSKPIEDKAEPIEDKVVSPQPGKIEVKIQKDPTCFLFWCW